MNTINWTPEELLAYECALDLISARMAICTSRIAREQRNPDRDESLIHQLREERKALLRESESLHVDDHEEILRIKNQYGEIVRLWREAQFVVAA